MSQEPCYLTSPGSIFRSFRSFVLPRLITEDVLCATVRILSRKQNPSSGVDVGRSSGVQDCRKFEGDSFRFSGVGRIGRQVDDSHSSADQPATGTPSVSVSAATSISTESSGVPSDSDPSSNSSSVTSTITPPPTNAASATDAGTASSAPPSTSVAETSVNFSSETTSSVTAASTSISSAGDSGSMTESVPPADPPITPSPPITFQPFPTSRVPRTYSRTNTPIPTRSFPWSIIPPGTSSSFSTSLSSLMDGGGSSAPALPPETTTTGADPAGPPPPSPVSTTSNLVTTTLPPILPSSVSNALPTPPSSTGDPIENSTPILPVPTSSSPPTTTSLNPFPTGQSWSYSSQWTDAASLSTLTLGTSTVIGIPSTSTFTTVFTTTLSNGLTSTVTTVVETGTLSTDTPKPSGLARSTGAMIGVALAATFAFILIVLLVFFACKRYRSRRSNHGSMENILAMAREVAWRPPLDGDDDDSYLAGYPQPHLRPPGSQGHSREDLQGGTYVGDHLSGTGSGVEVGNAGTVPTMNPLFGGQPYMPGFEQSRPNRPEPTPIPSHESTEQPETTQVWWGINDPQAAYVENRPPADGFHTGFGPGRSAASLTMVGGSSSGGHGGASSSGEHLRTSSTMKRNSLSSTRAIHRDRPQRSSTQPTAFPITSDPTFDYERQAQDQPDKTSVKGFFSRLRSSRRVSTQSATTIRPPQVRDESNMFPPVLNLYSPSLLNPPTTIPPPVPTFDFSGVTNGYTPLSISTPQDASQDQGFSARPPNGFWTPVTLPSAPSPVPTDNSGMVEGLLHPRLGMKSSLSHQASTTSLRDNVDYTRPINGLVNNHLRSTTTFETQDTIGPEDMGRSTGR